ncbi:MAG: PqqD family protein [Clostridia bacterium]|nr:PqqD family protein [Clostridia bacterium]
MKISDNFVVRKIGDSYYAVPLEKNPSIGNGMLKLNETAYFIWKKFEEGLEAASVAKLVCDEYAVDKDKAMEDVKRFSEKLKEVGALEGSCEA